MTTVAGDGRATTQTMLQGAVESPPLERMTVHQLNPTVNPCPLSYLLAHTPSPVPNPQSILTDTAGQRLLTNEALHDARSMLPMGDYCLFRQDKIWVTHFVTSFQEEVTHTIMQDKDQTDGTLGVAHNKYTTLLVWLRVQLV